MKRILHLFSLLLFLNTVSFAQDEEGGKVRERMTEYIQKRLGLSKAEAERFSPVFLNYYNDLRNTNRKYKDDRLVLQQKTVELRLNYRNQFKDIVGEKRSNDVFQYERDFVQEVINERRERQENNRNRNERPDKHLRKLVKE